LLFATATAFFLAPTAGATTTVWRAVPLVWFTSAAARLVVVVGLSEYIFIYVTKIKMVKILVWK
jgi:hypothetical protein